MLQFFKKLKLYTKLSPQTVQKYSYRICLTVVIYIIYKSIFHKGTSHWWFIGKIDNFIWKYFWYMSDFLFFFLLIAIFDTLFLYFAVTLVAAHFHAQTFLNCSNSLYHHQIQTQHHKWKSWSNVYHKTIFSNKWPCYNIEFIDSFSFWFSLITTDMGNV